MEWIVKIENDSKKRVLVKFDPLSEEIVFKGQYHTSSKDWALTHDVSWVDFSVENINTDNVSLEDIQGVIFRIYEKMNERLKAFNDLSESFKIIQTIGVKED